MCATFCASYDIKVIPPFLGLPDNTSHNVYRPMLESLWKHLEGFENGKNEILSLACLPFHHSRNLDNQALRSV